MIAQLTGPFQQKSSPSSLSQHNFSFSPSIQEKWGLGLIQSNEVSLVTYCFIVRDRPQYQLSSSLQMKHINHLCLSWFHNTIMITLKNNPTIIKKRKCYIGATIFLNCDSLIINLQMGNEKWRLDVFQSRFYMIVLGR